MFLLYSFEEDKIYFAFIPSLDLTGYGKTKREAQNSIGVESEEFLNYTHKNRTIESELKRLGWSLLTKKRPSIPPTMSKLISTNEFLRDVVNTKKYVVSNYQITIPTGSY